MLRSGQLLSYSELARDAGVAVTTARRYLQYLRIGYQVILLEPYRRNLTSAAVKTPKVYWTDVGLLRQGTSQWGPATGAMFETFVVTEVCKWTQTMQSDVRVSFYQTRSGREVDLVLETTAGVMGVEVKARQAVRSADLRGLRAFADALGSEWRGGIVLYRGGVLHPVDPEHDIWAVPAHRLF
jgi:predicted AAA+ superfamily ATPase